MSKRPLESFDERRLMLMLNDLDANRNVERVLKEISKLKIPESTARNFLVIERVSQFKGTPDLDKLVDIVIRKNKYMAEANECKKVRFAEKTIKGIVSEPVSAESIVLSPTPVTIAETVVRNSSPTIPKINKPTPMLPLKPGQGIEHSDFSPFKIVRRGTSYAQFLQAPNPPPQLNEPIPSTVPKETVQFAVPVGPAPRPTPPTLPEIPEIPISSVPAILRGRPYLRRLYQQVVAETTTLDQIKDVTVDQMLDEMNVLNGPHFLLRF
ncbi:hypothetical protein GCK72_025175 [Caenorhabditis remanei]|uniref:Uncharacterized protein n=1 Tax=Caenorhabditis remanei TaxID=31234 RepID=A0A6A5G195_CAERE|nr:hypothetical protein GCK72_025175 [Caenorhabditis remanei]KAF1748708.1 hypothetical protein GCK72_025175 [Caenorhabditis remanei]